MSDEFLLPYQFVPVLQPNTSANRPSSADDIDCHSRLRRDAHHGRMVLLMTTESPVFIGHTADGVSAPQGPSGPTFIPNFMDDGAIAIPASSIRGMISTVAGAASNSALRVLENQELSVWPLGQRNEKKMMGFVHSFFEKVDPELLPMNEERRIVSAAEMIFGYTSENERKQGSDGPPNGLASRIRFSRGKLLGDDPEPLLDPVTLKMLEKPKPRSAAL